MKTFLPGSTIGIFGGGQLGRMLVQAGHRMGFHFHVYDPSPTATAGRVADHFTCASYGDESALDAFAASVDLVTLEFENIDVAAVLRVAEKVPVLPGARVLQICQNRALEKTFLEESDIAVAPFAIVRSRDELSRAFEAIGKPAVLKTAFSGYDGKGQVKIEDGRAATLDKAWSALGTDLALLEKWVSHQGEYSCICARRDDGASRLFPMMRNVHRSHILAETYLPCGLDPQIEQEGQRITRKIAETLGVVGLITVEFFLGPDSTLLVNELAPRPHNSGHVTIEACNTSQFEQHIRAICGLPLGSPRLHSPAKMINLLGDRWDEGEPDWVAMLKDPNAHLHLYDKGEARPGRKMGHLTVFTG